jgi:TrpR-related protein YerC/YecD
MQRRRYFSNQRILNTIWRSLAEASTPEEAKVILSDLLYPSEIALIGQRLQIAQMIQNEWTYRQIREAIHANVNTVGRVWQTIQTGRGGYTRMLQNLSIKEEKEIYDRRGYKDTPEGRYLKRRIAKGK